ncbi:hypothetical protein IAR55_005315 [Kwoniella newhampshirensis]|uniref:Uncharacterized protein n=1 Tax=Kwoniella newhampshirensis TaxID=1651941 RepID=A0AAW0YH38_9TREE
MFSPPRTYRHARSSPSHITSSTPRSGSSGKMALLRDRDGLSVDLWTLSVDREILYSRASSVASILNTLGPSKGERVEGIDVICAYVQGKRAKGKSEEEIERKFRMLQGMVHEELSDMFVKDLRSITRHQCGLSSVLPPKGSIPPSSPLTPIVSSESTLETARTVSPNDLSFHSRDSTAPPSNLSISPFSTSTKASPFDLDNCSTSRSFSGPDSPVPTSCLTSRTISSSTNSSFSSPALALATRPAALFQQVRAPQSMSPASYASSLDSVSTLLSPLAIGGWGRGWERSFFTPHPRAEVNVDIGQDRSSIDSSSSCTHQPRWQRDATEWPRCCLRKGKARRHVLARHCRCRRRRKWNKFGVRSDHSQSDLWEWQEDDEETITGVESTWSATWSESSFGDVPPSSYRQGPTEASPIRDEYLRNISQAVPRVAIPAHVHS